jgi:hypothetical protein
LCWAVVWLCFSVVRCDRLFLRPFIRPYCFIGAPLSLFVFGPLVSCLFWFLVCRGCGLRRARFNLQHITFRQSRLLGPWSSSGLGPLVPGTPGNLGCPAPEYVYPAPGHSWVPCMPGARVHPEDEPGGEITSIGAAISSETRDTGRDATRYRKSFAAGAPTLTGPCHGVRPTGRFADG